MKLLVIYNHYAANNSSTNYKEILSDEFEKSGFDYQIIDTGNAEHAIKTVHHADFSNYDAIAAVGGDGTLFNVVNGYILNSSSKRLPIGVIPLGTGNAFARDLGIESKNIKNAVKAIKNGQRKRVDIGKFETDENEYYFVNIIGLGFVTDVAQTAHNLKIFGGFSYTLGVLYHTLHLKPFDVTIEHDDKITKRAASFIEISNTRYTGKDFLMAPDAKIDDGLFDITIMNKSSRLKLLSGLPKIFKGKHVLMDEVETIKARSIKISTQSPKVLTPDGEIFGSTPLKIECLPQLIEFFFIPQLQ